MLAVVQRNKSLPYSPVYVDGQAIGGARQQKVDNLRRVAGEALRFLPEIPFRTAPVFSLGRPPMRKSTRVQAQTGVCFCSAPCATNHSAIKAGNSFSAPAFAGAELFAGRDASVVENPAIGLVNARVSIASRYMDSRRGLSRAILASALYSITPSHMLLSFPMEISPFSRTGSLDNFTICVNASPPGWHITLDNLLQRE